MMKLFLLLSLSLFLVSCNKDGSDCVAQNETNEEVTNCSPTEPPSTDAPPVVVTPPTLPPVTDPGTGLPNAAYTFDTNILFVNTTVTQRDKFERAIEMIKKVVATEEFRSKVLNHKYGGVKTFVDNGGFSNAQIYQKILDGAEKLNLIKNNTMDMEVELYYAMTSTVGYTYPNSKRIWVNTKYFNTNADSGVAANLFHEWLHKLGFGHASSYSTSRDYSVPYAIGRIISTLGKSI